MDLNEAQQLLRSPRELTREQWRQAYEVIQEHNLRRLRETMQRPPDDDADD